MKMKERKWIPWVITAGFLLILAVAQVWIHPDFGDDLVYARIWGREPLGQFLQSRYFEWSSRVIIEAVMMPLAAANPLVWRILNILMVLLLVWITADLFGVKNSKYGNMTAQVLLFAMLWFVPADSLNNAGWITTTTNYLWPMTLGLVAMRPFRHWLADEKCRVWEVVLCPLCLLYAANMEQMGAILLGGYLVVGGYQLYQKKKLTPFYYVQLVLIVLSLCFILAAPGNAVRNLQETEHYFPEFAGLNVFEKLWIGFLETARYYVVGGPKQNCFLFALLTGVLFLGTLSRKKILPSAIAIFPFAFYFLVGHLGNYLLDSGILTRGRNVAGVLVKNSQLPGIGYFSAGMVVFQTIVYLAVLGCVGYTLWFLHGNSKETLLQLVILAAGFASRILVGFSPTVYASGARTALFASMAILIVTLRNLQLMIFPLRKVH